MLRRFSTKYGLSKDKKTDGKVETNGAANGTTTTNGVTGEKNGLTKRQSIFAGKSKSETSTDHSGKRGDVETSFKDFAQLVHASKRPLPTQTGDGTYIEHPESSSFLSVVKSLGFKDAQTLMAVMKTKAQGGLVDDRTYLMEKVIQLTAGLPAESKMRKQLTDAFLDELWNSLQHPPLSYLGDDFQFRKADGSNNNIMYPHLGAANTPYARSVNPGTLSQGALPDPGRIFDAVMARKEFKPHPNNVSSVFFYWASLIIHDLFQTDHHDFNISKTSSYLDLSILYGDTQEDQNEIRTFKDGKLKPDCFAEERLLGFPPGCGVLLVMLNRFHNHVVENLAIINDQGRFTKPSERPLVGDIEKAWAKYDNDLFQTGRLVTCGLYINVTLLDYVRTIINLNRSNTTWTLDPRAQMDKVFGNEGTPSGVGNQVSAEFNLAYRWHSCISDKDDKWTRQLYRQLFGKEAEDVDIMELLKGLGKWEASLPRDPLKRPFAGLQRGADGKFNDDELVELITSSIEDVAGAFGPNNVPTCLKAVTILGMQQARHWSLGSLNEFRKFFGLKPHDTFEDICNEPAVADQLKHLYEHPEFVEMYPGLISEDAKVPMVPGAGITPTFTISRAILSDAVALVRGDRFYTIDYNPKNLTHWGYCEVQYDLAVQQGCVLYKLFLRAFPNHFKSNSIYAHMPMTIPSENKKIMKNLGRETHYSWDRPTRMPSRIDLTSYKANKYILEQQKQFNVTWHEPLIWLMNKVGQDYMLTNESPFHTKQRNAGAKADNWHQQIKNFYEQTTLKLLHEKSYKIAGVSQVDITRDVGNLAHVHFAANVFSFPLKTEEHPNGIYTEHELYLVLATLFVCLFYDLDPAKTFALRMGTRAITQQLAKIVEGNVRSATSTGLIAGLVNKTHEHGPLKDYGVQMMKDFHESGQGAEEITWTQILPTAGAIVTKQAEVFTQILDYYLGYPEHLREINKLAKTPGAESDAKLLRYALEGIRLNSTFGSYRVATEATTLEEHGRKVEVKPGDRVFCNASSANREAGIFPDPEKVKLDRPIESYLQYGLGQDAYLGGEASRAGLVAMLRTVGKLDNLRRAPGPQGQLKKVPQAGGSHVYMRSDHGVYFPFPTTLKINWDGNLPALKK